jgi:hypothetical protein
LLFRVTPADDKTWSFLRGGCERNVHHAAKKGPLARDPGIEGFKHLPKVLASVVFIA